MRRDKYGIIIQTATEDVNYEDGGDSAFSTGLMAFSGSPQDAMLMHEFIVKGKLVRHPYQPKWDDPKETSRDQVLAFFAGLCGGQSLGPERYLVVESCLFYAKSWFVNKDILLFANKFYLYKCAGVTPPMWLYPLAYLHQALDLLWDCYIRPDEEMNQSICMNVVFGQRWISAMYRRHPNLLGNITKYFSGWRDKASIGIMLSSKVSIEAKGE